VPAVGGAPSAGSGTGAPAPVQSLPAVTVPVVGVEAPSVSQVTDTATGAVGDAVHGVLGG
jgi:hypothetical protein